MTLLVPAPFSSTFFSFLFPAAGDVDEEGIKDQEVTTEEQEGETTTVVEGEAESREVDEAGEEPSETGGKHATLPG